MTMNNQKIKQIANSMNLVAQLPNDDSLIHVIGTGYEKTNMDALCSWIEKQQDLLAIKKADACVEQLLYRLQTRLEEFCCVLVY